MRDETAHLGVLKDAQLRNPRGEEHVTQPLHARRDVRMRRGRYSPQEGLGVEKGHSGDVLRWMAEPCGVVDSLEGLTAARAYSFDQLLDQQKVLRPAAPGTVGGRHGRVIARIVHAPGPLEGGGAGGTSFSSVSCEPNAM